MKTINLVTVLAATLVGNSALGTTTLPIYPTPSRSNTGIGNYALPNKGAGSFNTGVGYYALNQNAGTPQTGSWNSALGAAALENNSTGAANTAAGVESSWNNVTGMQNAAFGVDALWSNIQGNCNVALGVQALFNCSGSFNIGIGCQGGMNLTDGSNNIDIGNVGVAGESNTIRIGTIGTHQTAIIAGLLTGPGADYAEYLPKADPAARFDVAEIIGVRNGHIVSKGAEADQYMVVTGQALMAGNRPGDSKAELDKHSLVSFMGQVPVRVSGTVHSGDYILASEKGDGTGIAMSAADIPPSAMHRVVGRAWEASDEAGLKTVNTVVGVDQTSLMGAALERLERENRELRAALKARDKDIETRLARLEQQTRPTAVPAKVALAK